MLFYIKAKVYITIRGISGESQEGVSRLVRAVNPDMAKKYFEEYCHRFFSPMSFDKLRFEYLEIAWEIN